MRILLLVAILLALMLCSCAHTPDPWTKEQKALAGAYTALHVVDWMQTNDIYNRPDEYYEVNPLVDWAHTQGGDLGMTAYFAGSLAATYGVAHFLPTKYRTGFLVVSNIVKIGCVGNNLHIGVGLGKPF